MKRNIKLLFLLISAFIVSAIFSVSAFAEDEEVAFAVTASDGTVTEYTDASALVSVISNAQNGDLITLCSTVQVDSGVSLVNTGSEQKVITIDLAGNGIYCYQKINFFAVYDNITLNLYSSKPDAYIYDIDIDDLGHNGSIFWMYGDNTHIKFGNAATDKENYPISTYSSCFVDINKENSSFEADGGNFYANVTDWKGFINPRSGTGVINIKNANIVAFGNNNIFYSEAATAKLMLENCAIIRTDGTSAGVFYQMFADVTFKNCVSNCCLKATSSNSGTGIVTLEGENYFAYNSDFDYGILKDSEGKVMARLNKELTLLDGSKVASCFDNSGSLKLCDLPLPENVNFATLTDPDKTVTCIWTHEKENITEMWLDSEKPVSPIELLKGGVEGLYKNGWLRKVNEDGSISYTSGNIVDFNIKVSVEVSDEIVYHILVPEEIISKYIVYGSTVIDDVITNKNDWSKRVVDGENYYEFTSFELEKDNINRDVEVFLSCRFSSTSGIVYADGRWTVNLQGYIERALAEEEKLTDEEISFINDLNRYLPSAETSASNNGQTARLPSSKKENM